MWNILASSRLCGTQKGPVERKNAATKLVTVLIFAVFCTRHPKTGAPALPAGGSGLDGDTNGPLQPAKSVLAVRMAPLTLSFSLNLAIMRYVPARLWLRVDEMPIQVQDRRGQRDPRKRPRARGAIMARPRCKPHRPFYFIWGNTASRASGSVVKVATASRANAPVRKCGVKYQVSWWEQPDSRGSVACIRHRRQGCRHGKGQLDACGSVVGWDRGGHCRTRLERMCA